MTTARWIPEKGDSGKLYFSAAYAIHEDLFIGFDYRPVADKVAGLATWRILDESEKMPGIVLATTNDDFTKNDEEINSQSISAVLAKALPAWHTITFAPYAGVAYLFELDDTRFVGGGSLRHDRISLLYQWSGTDHHLSASYDLSDQVGISLISWGLKYPGIGMRWRF